MSLIYMFTFLDKCYKFAMLPVYCESVFFRLMNYFHMKRIV